MSTKRTYPLDVTRMNDDEGESYASKGHHPVEEFRAEVAYQADRDVASGWPVRHLWQRSIPSPEGGVLWIPAKPGSRGAFPATMVFCYPTDDEGEPT